MPRGFVEEEEEFEQERPRRDTEITLGPAMLLAILSGLVLLCALCFGLGYTSGRRNASHAVTVTQSAAGQTVTSQPGIPLQKPQAKGTIPASSAQIVVQAPPPVAPGGNPLTSYAPTTANPDGTNPVRPALPAQPGMQQPNSPQSSTTVVQPALPPGAGVMVQIAAVSHVEDASVLMNALKKRGYAVVARREPSDSLIHVQVGPFANRADANAMSQRLLNDGYNAVVTP